MITVLIIHKESYIAGWRLDNQSALSACQKVKMQRMNSVRPNIPLTFVMMWVAKN